MNYSNPVRYFIDGNNEALFIFKPRKNPELFYIQARDKNYIPISVLIPATNYKDAKNLLCEAMEFKIKCCHEYIKNASDGGYVSYEERGINQAQLIINSIKGTSESYKIIVEKVRLDQIFKTCWAMNDTI